ncbi:MAG: hypothetical protein PHU21_10745 [Elusimicrobia bacterium]|nr:hypothetical protein [Elusimicrobiota bacterium]
MCLRTPAADPKECDCYECVEARRDRSAAAQSRGEARPAAETDVLESWRCAFHEAYREVQLEIFKAKIKKDLSKTMEKTAELVLETMMTELRENTRRARFQKDLRTKLEKLIETAAGD